MALRGDAPANAGCYGDSLFRALRGAVSHDRIAGVGAAGRGVALLGRAGLLLTGTPFARDRETHRTGRRSVPQHCRKVARVARHRRLHGRRGCEYRVPAARACGGRQCYARAGAPAVAQGQPEAGCRAQAVVGHRAGAGRPGAPWRLQSGAHGTGVNGLHADSTRMSAVPLTVALRRLCARSAHGSA
ncbi:hypothetical protein HRbin14_02296 [bacterium HR14]|nr:hypothetical protein HRbin14_02296 [bacterium HR14]